MKTVVRMTNNTCFCKRSYDHDKHINQFHTTRIHKCIHDIGIDKHTKTKKQKTKTTAQENHVRHFTIISLEMNIVISWFSVCMFPKLVNIHTPRIKVLI